MNVASGEVEARDDEKEESEADDEVEDELSDEAADEEGASGEEVPEAEGLVADDFEADGGESDAEEDFGHRVDDAREQALGADGGDDFFERCGVGGFGLGCHEAEPDIEPFGGEGDGDDDGGVDEQDGEEFSEFGEDEGGAVADAADGGEDVGAWGDGFEVEVRRLGFRGE